VCRQPVDDARYTNRRPRTLDLASQAPPKSWSGHAQAPLLVGDRPAAAGREHASAAWATPGIRLGSGFSTPLRQSAKGTPTLSGGEGRGAPPFSTPPSAAEKIANLTTHPSSVLASRLLHLRERDSRRLSEGGSSGSAGELASEKASTPYETSHVRDRWGSPTRLPAPRPASVSLSPLRAGDKTSPSPQEIVFVDPVPDQGLVSNSSSTILLKSRSGRE